MSLPTPDYLRQIFSYDLTTGELRYRVARRGLAKKKVGTTVNTDSGASRQGVGVMLDDDDADHYEPSPYRPLYPWREVATFTVSMVILIWIAWSFLSYAWSHWNG
jgi:hypothetical protein